jgi:hypothetical protein
VRIKVRRVNGYVLPAVTRMPFRFGIVVMTEVPQIFLRADVEIEGRVGVGVAAEGLVPKWFTKDPATRIEDDRSEMLAAVVTACELCLELEPAPSVFALWHALDEAQLVTTAADGVPPLLAGLGTSLVERAVIDAFCRIGGMAFADALRQDEFGIRVGDLHRELADARPADLLPASPPSRLLVRHTVGLSDPLTESEIPPAERVEDGLPQSLEACIKAYGLKRFKIKLCGDDERDLERLRAIVLVLEKLAPADWSFSLDGNEQFADAAAFRGFWDKGGADRSLAPALERLLFVEQPLRRDIALDEDAARTFRAWPERPPLVIDESDATLESLPLALACGYTGTSVKNCKGVVRGIASACLLESRRRSRPQEAWILTAEDLSTIGPVALLQDLAVVATLGLEHVERNGHHYFAGLSMFSAPVQEAVLRRHGDLYMRAERGYPTLSIRDGAIDIGSVVAAPFGVKPELDPASFAEPAFTVG